MGLRRGALGAGMLLAALAGCGIQTNQSAAPSGPAADSASTTAADPQVTKLVPAELKAKGKVVIATDPTYAPMIFKDDAGAIVGLDAEIAQAVVSKMGLKVEWVNVPFDGIIAGVKAKKFDVSWAAFSVTKERMKEVDFVSYLKAGTQILVKADNPKGIKSEQDLCGKTVSAQKGTTQAIQILPDLSKQCAAKGQPAIGQLILPQQDNVNQAVAVGRADAELADGALVAYQVKQLPDKFATMDALIDPVLVGAAVPKDAGTLRDAVKAGLDAIVADGSYGKILAKWNLTPSAVDKPQINPEDAG
ncbi:ABC transporter substrate-binding protein [Nonomuraea sediminis]|uniref:ABC transporter substrate-binding protein n=1 Tax=Nonomuraea sediminis TaxID=2835864 RepID=UPI001BDD0822|nr:ABC transporter substrate-binding protein [Nonomuraea sediminis]